MVCERQWRAVAYQKFSNGDFGEYTCAADGCTIPSTDNGNFISFGSKTDFDIFEHDGETEGVWGFQLTWRIDDATIAQIEWNQNWNPLDVSITTGKRVVVYGFRQVKCSDSGEDADFVQISFGNRVGSMKGINYSATNFVVELLRRLHSKEGHLVPTA